MKLSRILPLLAVSLSSLAISPKAEALTPLSSQTVQFTNQLTELNGTPLLTLNKYNDNATNPLVQVGLTFDTTLNSSGTVTNTASGAQTFTVLLSVLEFNLDVDPLNAPSALVGQTYSPFTTNALIGSRRYASLAPNTPAAFGLFTINASTGTTFTAAPDLAGFVGAGTFSFAPSTTILTSYSGGGGNVSTNISTFADARVTVTYYGNVPFDTPYGPAIPVLGSIVALAAMRKARKNLALKSCNSQQMEIVS